MKVIDGYESYLVTESGDVFSTKRNRYLTKSYNLGYAKVIIKVNGVHHNKLVHRLVAQAFIPNPENKPQVNHKDCDKSNNHISNLEWCTQSENTIHAFKHGLMVITDRCKKNQKEALGFKVIDTSNGEVYGSIGVSALKFGIPKSSLRSMLIGDKFNETTLKYLTK
jgi:hypothetical protein